MTFLFDPKDGSLFEKMSLTGILFRQTLAQNDPSPGKPRRGELFLSYLIIKNLADFCETGRSILTEMRELRLPTTGLPNDSILKTIQDVLKSLYQEEMFISDDEYGQKPNWKNIDSFDPKEMMTAWRLYRIFRKNIQGTEKILHQIESRNKIFFSENIDLLFHGVPFKELVSQVKNFIQSDHVPSKSQELIWEYCESLVAMILNEKDNMEIIERF